MLALALASCYGFVRIPPKYGLDIKGGIRLRYGIDDSKITPEQRSNMGNIRDNVERYLQKECARYGDAATITRSGATCFTLELAGYKDLVQDEKRF